jgi:DNA excision repair protein ERCC-4
VASLTPAHPSLGPFSVQTLRATMPRRLSARTAPPLLRLIEDTRQQWHEFRSLLPPGVEVVERRTMSEGDLTTEPLWGIAAIEIKREDYAASIGRDRERVDREIRRLHPYKYKAIVVADDITSVYRKTQVHPHAILGTIASLLARHDCPTIFCGNDAGAVRVICGLLRRWEERVAEKRRAGAA